MRRLIWLSLIPFMSFWLFSLGIYGSEPSTVYSIGSILLGIIISGLAFNGSDVVADKRYTVFVLPLAISSFIIPYPYSAGLIATALALLVFLLGSRFGALGLGILFGGIVLAAQASVLPLYYILATSPHQLGWLSFITSFLYGFTGLPAASSSGMVFIYGQGNVFPFTVTLEKLGIYPWVLIFIGAVVLIMLISRSISAALKLTFSILSVSAVYFVIRYLLLINVFFATDLPEYAGMRMEIYTDPIWLLASFIPLVLLFFAAFSVPGFMPGHKVDLKPETDRRHLVAYSLVFLGVLCLTGAALFQDPGIKKDGRVLVDEIHSIWEFSTLKLDKNWYGDNSTYNAYSMIEWLNETYDVDRVVGLSYKDWNVSGAAKVEECIVSEKISYDLLKGYDILIIKTPSSYESYEVDAIERFVKEGGGLFLIGDHTNFDGTSTNLNQIARKFGFEFNFDSVNTIEGKLYTHERGRILHPCLRYMPFLDFMTGCSLSSNLGAEPVILGFGLEAEPGEYASSGFFRETRRSDPTRTTDTILGLIYQAIAIKHGKGRVVAFADSTIISNFRIFFGGSPNFVIGCMEYLNYRNSFMGERPILLLLGILILCFAIYMLGKTSAQGEKRVEAMIIIMSLAAISVSGGLAILSVKPESSIPSQFYDRNSTICFDGQHSSQIVGQNNKSGEYETFFIWTQRVGKTPSVEDSLPDSMEKGRALVIIDPATRLTLEDITSIKDYVMRGNFVLLMVNSKGLASNLIKSFGMDIYRIEAPKGKNLTSKGEGLPINPWGLAIKGGHSLLAEEGRVVLAEKSYGEGKFVLFIDSNIFKDGFGGRPGNMGYPKTNPDGMKNLKYDLMELYELEYYILEDALANGSIETEPYRTTAEN